MMKNYISKWIAGSSMLLVILFTACDDIQERAEVSTAGSLADVTAEGGDYKLNVGAEGSWVISFSGNGNKWCSVNPSQGVDNAEVKVKIGPNYENKTRTTLLLLESGSYQDSIRIVQQAWQEDSANIVFGRYEIPRLTGDQVNYKFIQHEVEFKNRTTRNYCMEYDLRKRHSRWVAFTAYDLTAADNISRTDAWGNDPQLPEAYWTKKEDYSGYDRGHLVASNDRRYCLEANQQTFYYSNMSPQLAGFNQKIWQKLEENVKEWMQSSSLRDTLYIVKGGTLGEGQVEDYIGESQIAVPKYYYMAVLARKNDNYQAIAFWLEHKEYPEPYDLKGKAISVAELEEKTGIDFFPALPDRIEVPVQKTFTLDYWTWKNE